MEPEKMQILWEELNERVARNELIRQQDVAEMLSHRKKNDLQKMLRIENIMIMISIIMTIFLLYCFTHLNKHSMLWLWITVFGVIVFSLVMGIISRMKLTKVIHEKSLEKQVRNTLEYKLFRNRYTLLTYLSLIPYCIAFFYYLGSPFNNLVFGIVFLLGCLADYFIFHHVTDKIKEITTINQKLRDINSHTYTEPIP